MSHHGAATDAMKTTVFDKEPLSRSISKWRAAAKKYDKFACMSHAQTARARRRHDPRGIPRVGGPAADRPFRAHRRYRGCDGASASLAQPPQSCGARCPATVPSKMRGSLPVKSTLTA